MIVSVCKSCGAPIFYATSQNGKDVPIDAHAVADGNILVSISPCRDTFRCVILSRESADTVDPKRNRYTSHFATCPNASAHRRRKPSRKARSVGKLSTAPQPEPPRVDPTDTPR